MTVEPTGAGAPNIIERAKNILLQPQSEWDRIAGEQAEVGKLYTGYVLPLAAIAAICGFIGLSVFGASAFGVSYRVPMLTGAVSAVLQVVMGLVGVYVLAMITNALAPNFGSRQDMGQAHKLAAYGSTAGFLAGVFAILPPLAILGILGLYSLVLIYIGLPRLMGTPEDKRIGYFITIIVAAIVLWLVIGAVMGLAQRSLGGFGGPAAINVGAASAPAGSRGEITLPGGGAIDVATLERTGEAMAQGGGAAAQVDPTRLEGYLPQTLPGGFRLESASTSSAMGASEAEGVYRAGDARLELSVVHLGPMGGIAGMAGAMGVNQSERNADGYSRTNTVDGRVITERVNTAQGSATYAVIGRGVGVTAEGSGGVSIDQARAAVETVGVARLEREFGS